MGFWGASVGGSVESGEIVDGAVTNAKLADMAEATFKMRAAAAGTGDPIDGTAAQARAVLSLSINVKNYGAVGDGVTDDTSSIASAVTAAHAANVPIYFPTGTYITGKITFTEAIQIFGDGPGLTIIKLKDTTNDALFYASSVDLLVFRDLQINGNRAGQTTTSVSQNGIYLQKCNHARIENVHFVNCNENGIRFEGCKHVMVRRCYAATSRVNGFYQIRHSDATTSAFNTYIGCHSFDNDDDGIVLDPGSYDTIIDGFVSNVDENVGIVIFTSSDDDCQRNVISNFVVNTPGLEGVGIAGSFNKISNGVILNPGLLGGAGRQNGFIQLWETGQTNHAENDIQNVSVIGAQEHGFLLKGASTHAIYRTRIRGCSAKNSSQATGNTYSGFKLEWGDEVQIEHSDGYDTQGSPTQQYGIDMDANTADTFIFGGRFDGNATGRVNLAGATTRILHMDEDGDLGVGTNAPGARGDFYKAGTVNVEFKLRNDNVTLYGLADSGAAYWGTSTNHPFLFLTNNAERGRISATNFVWGTAALATTATDGFVHVPGCAGAPTGVPTAFTGRVPIVVDTTNNKLYFYSGGAWRDAGP